jgi:hypothetical protein
VATAEEILKKAEKNRKKSALDFKPKKRRAWDFVFEKKEGSPKYRNNIETIQEQSRSNTGTIQEQYDNNTGTIYKQNGDKCGNINGNKKDEIYSKKIQSNPLDHKKTSGDYDTTTEVLCAMNGIQNKIMRQIISHIKNQPTKNYSIDIPIAILAEKINASKESIRVSIKRLQKKIF